MNDSLLVIHPWTNYDVAIVNPDGEPIMDSEYIHFMKLQEEYERGGMIRSVQAVLLTYEHCIPHVVLLKTRSGNGLKVALSLPGRKLRYQEEEVDGLKKVVAKLLGIEHYTNEFNNVTLLSKWWRPHFEGFIYPYVPSHVTKPKEQIKVYAVEIPRTGTFYATKYMEFIPAPLCEIYNNEKYGPIISSIPQALSRLKFLYAAEWPINGETEN